MKFTFAVVAALLVSDKVLAFVPNQSPAQKFSTRTYMAADMPPPAKTSDLPVIQQNSYGQPADVRYSDFLKLINADRIEKVTFSADGSQLLGVDVDGARVKIEALPNDPDLLTQLTTHKVHTKRICSLRNWDIHRSIPTHSPLFSYLYSI
jgi:hypothetical protein